MVVWLFGHALPCYAAAVVGPQDAEQRRVLLSFWKVSPMIQRTVLCKAREVLSSFVSSTLDVFTISRPQSAEEAVNLAKVLSKFSPLIGNLIEFKTVEMLNKSGMFKDVGTWKRQDPGFPDVILDGRLTPAPGLEIKAWFPLATEITGRFKDSQKRFVNDEIDLAILAWLPEHLLWGKPKIISVLVVSAKSAAEARDSHYHKPPHYVVIEPEDTASRTSNLQQSNTNGYVIQNNTPEELALAQKIIDSWGRNGSIYSTEASYQNRLKHLMASVNYRLDTNFSKLDRIGHKEIELFKTKVFETLISGKPIKEWISTLKTLSLDTASTFL